MQTKDLLNQRGSEYGPAWSLTGEVLGLLRDHVFMLITKAPQLSFNWVIMLNKLIRMLASPYKEDHYEDLIGYATLSLEAIRKEKVNDLPPSEQ